MQKSININDFDYSLPEGLIAKYPIKEPSKIKLLIRQANSDIDIKNFDSIPDILPANTSLYVNETKVIYGRLFLKKETGGSAELLLIEPIEPSNDPQFTLQAEKEAVWEAMIGGRRIRQDTKLTDENKLLFAYIISLEKNIAKVKLKWESGTLADILIQTGSVPIPNYLKRGADDSDKINYQSIFAVNEGSIAAPTASLHFNEAILKALDSKGINRRKLTLHVGPGTFLPVQDENISNHKMHSEMIIFEKSMIESLYLDLRKKNKIACVGTTSIRSLESLYYIALNFEEFQKTRRVPQWVAFETKNFPPAIKLIEELLNKMNRLNLDKITGRTELIIVPGFDFKFTDFLFTNFHIPKSTLLLLVSAFIGDDWKKVYKEAIDGKFRMLSYGDTSLLMR